MTKSKIKAPIIEAGPALTSEQENQLAALQAEEAAITQSGTTYTRGRALLFQRQHRFVKTVGLETVKAHALSQGYEDKSTKLTYHIAAQLLLGVNAYARKPGTDAYKDDQNRVAPVAKMMAALEHRAADHAHLDDNAFVEWFIDAKRADGIIKDWQRATRTSAKVKEPVSTDAILQELRSNPGFVEVEADLKLFDGSLRLYVADGDGAKTRLLPLRVSPEIIAGLADHAPAPLDGVPADVRFYHDLFATASRLIPDGLSDIPVRALAEDDEVNSVTEMRNAFATYLYRAGAFTVASARKRDTIVLEVEPAEELDLGLGNFDDAFIDNVTRRRMAPRLASDRTCSKFKNQETAGGQPPRGGLVTILPTEGEAHITFKHDDKKLGGRLMLKGRNRMNSVWTHVVGRFQGTLQADLHGESRTKFQTVVLPLLAKAKASVVTLSFDDKGAGFAAGKAAATWIADEGVRGRGSVKVMRSDLLAAVGALLDLPAVDGELTILADPVGLVRLRVETAEGRFSAFLQTVTTTAEGVEVRETALLRRVTSDDVKPPLAA